MSYLDLPDPSAISHVFPSLNQLVFDPVLHHTRLRIVAPSRVHHALFGIPGRPGVVELVQRGVIRGLPGIERRWRDGEYMYSPQVRSLYSYISHVEQLTNQLQSVSLYNMSRKLALCAVRQRLTTYLFSRPTSARHCAAILHQSRACPDEESSSHLVSPLLLPALHRLKWAFSRDRLARKMKRMFVIGGRDRERQEGILPAARWVEGKARGIVEDGDRVRLAVCPGIRHIVRRYEALNLAG